MMEVKNLSYHYKGCPEVLKDVSFRLEPGKFLAVLGNNGVGKSTLLKCFNHILKPDSGEVMNGDISGYALTIGELCAVAVYALL